jgi:PAS domain S-box-containing protein
MFSEYFEQFLDSFKDAICITDHDGVVVYLNERHSELTGIPKDSLLGKSAVEMMKHGLFDMVINPEVVKTGQSHSSIQNANGRKLILEGTPIFDSAGQVAFVITFIRDVTTLADLKRKLAIQKKLLDTFQTLGDRSYAKYPMEVHSPVMRKLYAQVDHIADTDATVLITGETGVGKDVIARHIHSVSQRSEQPFIKADCSSIPESLIETVLFGYTGGTFSGADRQGKVGLVEAASGGTLFLDEIGELPLIMQSRLLRLLQDREVMRVGATSPTAVDVRIVAATNRDLDQAVHKGSFRSDLYYRLKVAVIKLPPLRERRADILPMAHGFLEFFCAKYKRGMTISPEADEALLRHTWPGNARELENLIQGLVVASDKSIIEARDLPFAPRPQRHAERECDATLTDVTLEGRTFKEIMLDIEGSILRRAIDEFGSVKEVSRRFGINRSTIFRKLREADGAADDDGRD